MKHEHMKMNREKCYWTTIFERQQQKYGFYTFIASPELQKESTNAKGKKMRSVTISCNSYRFQWDEYVVLIWANGRFYGASGYFKMLQQQQQRK